MKPGRNIKLVLAFDGTSYHGWQMQPKGNTIQGELAEAIRRVTGEHSIPVGSGRTDAGTHARGFVASFRTASTIPAAGLQRALNSVLPADIRVISARHASSEFHARRSARSKIYRYQIYRGQVMPPHMAREHYHYPYRLDLDVMQQAAALFPGIHDFGSFAVRGGEGRNTTRHIFACRLNSRGLRLLFTVEGNGFLHHMVRTMMGTLLEIGRGRMALQEFRSLFECRDRSAAGSTIPARGLILLRVRY